MRVLLQFFLFQSASCIRLRLWLSLRIARCLLLASLLSGMKFQGLLLSPNCVPSSNQSLILFRFDNVRCPSEGC
jgi:hypothetical protein